MAPPSGEAMATSPRRLVGVIAAVLAAMFLLAAPVSAQPGAPTYPQLKAASVVPEYAVVLQALDPAQPESILKARDAALAKYANAGSVDADAVFRQFWAFYGQALVKVGSFKVRSALNRLLTDLCDGRLLRCTPPIVDAFLKSDRPQDVRRREASRNAVGEIARYRASGVWFSWGEGDWYAAPDPAFVSDVANKLPLGELGAWVTFWAAEEPERVAEDASIVIGWEGVRRRLARWEAFECAHPALPETQVEIQPHLAWLAALYVFGIDNTPAYDTRFGGLPAYDVRVGGAQPFDTRAGSARGWTVRIDPELKSSYDRFLVQNRDSAYYTVIDGVVGRLRTSGGAPTKELVDFLKGELTDPYFADWLRRAERWIGRQ
jgi:hypothetical protein